MFTVSNALLMSAAWSSVSSVVEWLKCHAHDQHSLSSKPTVPFCCVLGKNTLRHILLLGGLGKQTAISWHLWKQVGVIAYPMY